MPTPGDIAAVSALYTPADPTEATSPYHAFSHCPPTDLFAKPTLWPGPACDATTARLLWNESALYICYECEGQTAAPIDPASIDPLAHASLGAEIPECVRSVLLDERVEVFVWPEEVQTSAGTPKQDQTYYAFECNYDGLALTNKAKFGSRMDFSWGGDAYSATCFEIAVGWGATSSPVPSAVGGMSPPFKTVVILTVRWAAMGIDPAAGGLRIGLHRASWPAGGAGNTHAVATNESKLDKDGVSNLLGEMMWSSWIEPTDAPEEVNFHRHGFFGSLQLVPEEESGVGNGNPLDCSCCAARLISPNVLAVLPSPKPLIEQCPSGSVLVKAKYASVCGSDMPYFKAKSLMSPSSYWDRDGFCGHEVVGVVVESKSQKFKVGDEVMALPSSYFKAHTGSKQEWYNEERHSVLLENFPVRGAFSQIYTSHEIYCYPLKNGATKEMIAAQGLGTVLRLARKLGPVIGKVVVVVGQGQNGLIATRLMSQFAAKAVIAIDPLEYRRQIAMSSGATHCAAPEGATELIHSLTDGRGADVVIEMVGHNQQTINTCMDYVRCSGIVAAFGVRTYPVQADDAVYDTFEFSKFFRKNINLIASVIPDPDTDFPEAVSLIEQGRFSTEGIFSHTMPLKEVQRGFEIASQYLDNVVKLVIEL